MAEEQPAEVHRLPLRVAHWGYHPSQGLAWPRPPLTLVAKRAALQALGQALAPAEQGAHPELRSTLQIHL